VGWGEIGLRVRTALIFGAVVAGVLAVDAFIKPLGGLALLAFVLAVIYLACKEACSLAVKRGINAPEQVATWLATSWALFAYYWWVDQREVVLLLLTIWLAVACIEGLLTAVFHLRDNRSTKALVEVGFSSLVGAVIGGLLSFLGLLRGALSSGVGPVVLALSSAWGTDVVAYFSGKALGRRRLWERVSPGKTVEGMVGGLLAGALVWGVASGPLDLPAFKAVLAGVAVSALAQVGDLLESAYKRWAGVKDSGRLLPGHGGVLDRFDSVSLSAPATFLLLKLLAG